MSHRGGLLLVVSVTSALIVCLSGAGLLEEVDVVPALLVATAATLPQWATLLGGQPDSTVEVIKENPLTNMMIVPLPQDVTPILEASPTEVAADDQILASDPVDSHLGEPTQFSGEEPSLLAYLSGQQQTSAQCPSCGRHDVTVVAETSPFRCAVCEAMWSVGVLAPWPRTIGNPARSLSASLPPTSPTNDVNTQGALEP